jgi:streptomycin 6-kinase
MVNPAPEIPSNVRLKAELLGKPGRAWMEGLPEQLAELEHRWGIKVGSAAPKASEAFVAEAVTAAGEPAMLKIVIAGLDPGRRELRVLRAAEGRGYAGLICADEAANAMLLERLGPQLASFALPERPRLAAICASLRTAWRPVPRDLPLPTGAEIARTFAERIEALWLETGRPCSERAVELALEAAQRRIAAFDPAAAVLAHGDAHQWNLLESPSAPAAFKLVDPDGVAAERELDLAVSMREWVEPVFEGEEVASGHRRCSILAALGGGDPLAIWDWGILHCLESGLGWVRLGLFDKAPLQLAMPDAWAASGAWPPA